MDWIYEINILVHVALGLACLMIGAYLLIEIKGNDKHKKLGKIYALMMFFLILTSVFIKQINQGQLSWLHFLSVVIFLAMIYALVKIKQKNTLAHKQAMSGIYVGLCFAGVLSVSIPGRFFTS